MVPLGSPENFDVCHHAIVHVCGLPSNINKEDSTFDIHPEQYLSATKTANNAFPVRCGFPSTARWEKYKPMPGKGKPAVIEGLLTGVERNDDRTVKYFIVDLEKVTFISQGPAAPKAEESPTKPSAYIISSSPSQRELSTSSVNSGTPARLKFTGFFRSQEPNPDAKSDGPASKKRKTADDLALEESGDKGEGSSTGRRAQRH
jgi:hypothetical protein